MRFHIAAVATLAGFASAAPFVSTQANRFYARQDATEGGNPLGAVAAVPAAAVNTVGAIPLAALNVAVEGLLETVSFGGSMINGMMNMITSVPSLISNNAVRMINTMTSSRAATDGSMDSHQIDLKALGNTVSTLIMRYVKDEKTAMDVADAFNAVTRVLNDFANRKPSNGQSPPPPPAAPADPAAAAAAAAAAQPTPAAPADPSMDGMMGSVPTPPADAAAANPMMSSAADMGLSMNVVPTPSPAPMA